MRRLVWLALLVLPALTPLPAAAQTLAPAIDQGQANTRPPPGAPHAFTPAPTPGVVAPRVTPANRAGGAMDAGPMNATPFSSAASPVLTGDQPSRALRDSRPGQDPTGASVSRD